MKEIHVKAKQGEITGAASTITTSNLTASRALVSDSNGKVAVSAVTSTELGYLDGVTSNIQTQLNAKQDAISGTANAVMITDANGKPTVSSVITVSELNKLNGLTPTTTELNYMDGVTSNVQDQIDAITGGGMSPDWANCVQLTESGSGTYTAPNRGYFMVFGGDNTSCSITVGTFSKYLANGAGNTSIGIPVAKGDVIQYQADAGAWFVPYK